MVLHRGVLLCLRKCRDRRLSVRFYDWTHI